jgi:hypothetical protein
MEDLILIVRLQQEDLDDLTLLQKKIYFHLEEGSFYSGNILIKTQPEGYWTYYFFFWHRNVFIEKWSFPYKNDIEESEIYLLNVFNIIKLLLKKYPEYSEGFVELEFTKIE